MSSWLVLQVPRTEGKGTVEVLGSSHHNHATSPLPAPARDVLETEDESAVMLPQSASLLEMFQVRVYFFFSKKVYMFSSFPWTSLIYGRCFVFLIADFVLLAADRPTSDPVV